MSMDLKDVFDGVLEDSWTMESVGVLILVEQRQNKSSRSVLDRMGPVSLEQLASSLRTQLSHAREPQNCQQDPHEWGQ